MFKVLIVDDEIYVASLILKLIEWEQYNMEVIATADNGFTALELVQLHQPDIVIVDVKMPGCDGITFMQKVRDYNSNVRFIVISGHKRFDYAKSAMKYNIEDYLLKPINKEELEEILLKLKISLTLESESRATLEMLDSELDLSKQKVRNYFMEQFVHEQLPPPSFELNLIREKYDINFCNDAFLCFAIRLDSSEKELDKYFVSSLLCEIAADIQQKIMLLCHEILCFQEGYQVYFLLNYQAEQETDLFAKMREAKLASHAQLEKFEKLFISFCLGRTVKQVSHLYLSLTGTKQTVHARLCLGIGGFYEEKQIRKDEGLISAVLSDAQQELLSEAVRQFNPEAISKQIKTLFERARGYSDKDSLIYQKLIEKIINFSYEKLSQAGIIKKSYEIFSREIYSSVELCTSSQEIAEILAQKINAYIEAFSDDNTQFESPAIRIAKTYIAKNYQNDISLNIVAEAVNLSPVYFSILFKREVGQNYIDYLNQYRINVARDLLKDIKYNVNEVASSVGFNDTRYFSKTFKKIVGITPSQYKVRNTRP